ncbi:hypothetical protein [Acinetobacter pittii]|uniref:hypothetical protein n=2 Tax=Acinetobacter pittii TaxID=48296 RepID=UPI0013EE649C|nr:hypothetical protein [Acinetobacter pittii]
MMNNFHVTSQSKYFNKEDQYKVKNQFLKKCLGYGDNDLKGFSWGKGVGYAFLTFFTEQALNFRRFPNHMDRIWSEPSFPRANLREFNDLTSDEINEIIEEVRTIYSHTQLKLQEKELNEIQVIRRIRFKEDYPSGFYFGPFKNHAQLLFDLKSAAEYVGLDTIQIEMDILNSFGEGAYSGPISIYAKIKAEDVFYCHELLDLGNDHLEPCEWVIINKDPKGNVKIPVTWIQAEPKHDLATPLFESKDEAHELLNNIHLFRFPQQRGWTNRWVNKYDYSQEKRSFLQKLFGLFYLKL